MCFSKDQTQGLLDKFPPQFDIYGEGFFFFGFVLAEKALSPITPFFLCLLGKQIAFFGRRTLESHIFSSIIAPLTQTLYYACVLLQDSAGSMPWSSGSSAIMWRGENVGMSRLLRENAQDIEECENSSRTSSNSSGTTLKASAIISDNPIMCTYDKSRDRDYSAAARAVGSISSSRWLQYGDQVNFAGSLPSTTRMLSTHEHNLDSYLNPAAVLLSAYGGPLLPHVFSGTKSSNAKEGSNPVIRICAQCKTMRTPLWRNGPQGPKVWILSLCL